MIGFTTILFLQTGITLLVVFLRTQSAKRALAQPPRGYKEKLLQYLKSSGKRKKLSFGIKNGAVRGRLISVHGSIPRMYSNWNTTGSLLKIEDLQEQRHLLESLCQKEEGGRKDVAKGHAGRKTLFGFFHPYCNAGGGGEKVLWKAVETTLKHDLDNIVIIYTGDVGVNPDQILDNVSNKFDYELDSDRIVFIYLKYRWLVDSGTWPLFTLLGQALGSIILTIEAVLKCTPDIWCDTMGYPFGYPWVAHLLRIPIVTYTHFPVISSDMLDKLAKINTVKNRLKLIYWKGFMLYYEHIGSYITIATTNSTWTNQHIEKIWKQLDPIKIYPPCSTEKLVDLKKIDQEIEAWTRSNYGVVLCQFRPEKRHKLIIESYAKYLAQCKSHGNTTIGNVITLKFIGTTRSQDDKDFVEYLINYCQELNIPRDNIEFITDCSYDGVKRYLSGGTYGINAMWNEHFGIAVVEYIASGLIPLVHASAGPYLDIVSRENGFFFVDGSDPDYSSERARRFGTLDEIFEKASELSDGEKISRSRIGERVSLEKFSDEMFEVSWIDNVLHALER